MKRFLSVLLLFSILSVTSCTSALSAEAPAEKSTADDKIASVLGEKVVKKSEAETVVENSEQAAEKMRRANDKLDSLLGGRSGE